LHPEIETEIKEQKRKEALAIDKQQKRKTDNSNKRMDIQTVAGIRNVQSELNMNTFRNTIKRTLKYSELG